MLTVFIDVFVMATYNENVGVISCDLQQLSNCYGDKVKVNPRGQNVSR